ncbi:hypothetical protein G7Y89_g5221 [Cudoniella acicularis]|uniref:Polyketide synthase n=1 Tax=Cudoniella acicularis TaxID=354080 RepID=A0A8H4RMX1_9HELO|nr:hypothetical protein G7Y89_g5221 [Cudoniella acicularis]
MESKTEESRSSTTLEKNPTVDAAITLVELPLQSTTPSPSSAQEVVLAFPKRKLPFYMSNIFLGLLSLLIGMDATTLPVALPVIASQLHGTTFQSFWANISFILAVAVTQPLYSSVSDVLGRKLPLYISMVIFTGGSIIFATANTMSVVVVGRLFMGLGGGGMDMLSGIILTDLTTLRERPLWLGVNMGFAAIGTVAGPILGGSLSQFVSWRWLGWINLPIIGVGFLLAILFLHLKPIDAGFRIRVRRLDTTGMVLYTVGITLVAVPLSWAGALYPWSSWKTIVPLLVGIGLLIALGLYEKKAVEPVFAYRIFNNITANVAIVSGFVVGLVMYPVFQYLPLFFQAVFLQTPLKAAISTLPFCGVMLVFSAIAGVAISILRRYRWMLWISWFLTTTFLGLFCLLNKSTSRAEAYSLQVMVGIGIGTVFTVNTIPIEASVQHVDDTGLAAGTLTIFRLFGALIGLTVSATVFNSIFEQKFTAGLAALPSLHALEDSSKAISFIPSLRQLNLPKETMDSVIDVYQESFQSVWIALTCAAGVGFLCSLLIKELTLEKDDVEIGEDELGTSGIHAPNQLWDFLMAGGDARSRVPLSRYNISAYYSPTLNGNTKAGTTNTEYGYFLDESVDLGALDSTFFSMPRTEVAHLDPQQRILLEVARESLDDAGEAPRAWRGKNVGVYVGSYGSDWADNYNRETQQYGAYQINTTDDFSLSNRVSYEMDLRGPSMTIRTACSSSLIGLNEACAAMAKGDCTSAIIGGTSILMAPAMTAALSEKGTLAPDGSCKSFSAAANGYARGEAIVAVFLKPLHDALRDGNPIRAVITATSANSDGKTHGFSVPSASAQEALIRHTYRLAGIADVDVAKTAFFECHGTGTPAGDPPETEAVANVFGATGGIHIGSSKPNLGHSEGASGLTSLLKVVLALEHKTLPPNIKSFPLNPKIPFERGRLTLLQEAAPWPEGRCQRVSLNSFGIGGSNAHAIIESAASFRVSGVSRMTENNERILHKKNIPQLLVYSANTTKSLKEMIQRYQIFLETSTEPLADVAYTLANRREHLPYRSFIVSTKDTPGIPAPLPLFEMGQIPSPSSLVMIFTGQGAQWPRMGRELRSNLVFNSTIKSLDDYLQGLGATWSLEEELFKPARTSRISEAEFSQPLCTAIQLALIDAFFAIGIKPAAVIGHSSGEIAAAYAAGGLSLKEAISVAFHRGAVQTKRGAMAAIGLSWEETQKHLIPGVVLACDNFHKGVTISGDTDKLERVLADIKNLYPTILTSMLNVDRAYHSHHMNEVGEDYHRAMKSSGVVGEMPLIPVFSSVTGELLGKRQLGPKYWQENLERPVRFKTAVCNLLKHSAMKDPIFLEVGPHPSLAGPLRQILAHESILRSSLVSTLRRGKNSLEDFLSAVGKLYTLHVDVDFDAMMPMGSCSTVPGLPCYPWDHQKTHWYESRVSKEWRHRPYPYHDLLGRKVLESTDLEPVWRNLLHLDNVPWIGDHKINDDIVFPFSAYVAMAAEGIQQISGIQLDSVGFRKTAVGTALLLNEDTPTELVTAFHRQQLTKELESEWWEFTISSHNGSVWTKHCTGAVRAEAKMKGKNNAHPKGLARKVSRQRWYKAVSRRGLNYGPHFRTLEEVTCSTMEPQLATARVRNNCHGDEAAYHLHPVIVDSFFQLLSLAARSGLAHTYRRLVATSFESLTISRCSWDYVTFATSAELVEGGSGALGEGFCIADLVSETVLQVSGARMTLLDDDGTDDYDKGGVPITARSEWVPHIDFVDVKSLMQPNQAGRSQTRDLEDLAILATSLSKRLAAGIAEVQISYLKKYTGWLDQQQDLFLKLDIEKLVSRIDSLVNRLAATPAAPVATAISRISASTVSILSGEQSAFDILNSEDTLNKINAFEKQSCSFDQSLSFIQTFAYSNPSLRVLELGAGFGAATGIILKNLRHSNGQLLYSQYVGADVSMGMISVAKDRFQGIHNLEFAALNVSKDLFTQGFDDDTKKFDLIIAAGILHTTPALQTSLRNIHKLLAPNGRLLIQGPVQGSAWRKYVLGVLPGWWCDVEGDGEVDEGLYISPRRWEEQLVAAGFTNPDIVQHEDSTAMIIAKPRADLAATSSKRITILCRDNCTPDLPLVRELDARGYSISRCTIDTTPPHGEDVIALLDLEEGPFLENVNEATFENFKSFIAGVHKSESGILWVTRLSQTHCPDPRYAPVIGLSRTLRSEMGIKFCICETDDSESVAGCSVVADVICAFQKRGQGSDGPGLEFEYAVSKGNVLVHRLFPFSLEDDLPVEKSFHEAVLKIRRPGRFDTMHWAGRPAVAPQEDEVEMEVYATCVNFRDIMVAMGKIELPELIFGYEAAGIVRRIGPNVTKFLVGDRVFLMGVKTSSTVVVATERLFELLPRNMSFADGAGIPFSFTTAMYCLMNIGHLEKGKSVLIHSGCSSIGLAAVQISRMVSAEIYTTVSSEEEVIYLIENYNIPRSRIFDSQASTFADDLMRATKRKGVDIALNSLSGHFLHETWRCVAKWGMMVDIASGERDLIKGAKLDLDIFSDNRSYCSVDMYQMTREKPTAVERSFSKVMEYFGQGFLHPNRIARVFSPAEIKETFEYMQQGKHVGNIILELRDTSTGRLRMGEISPQKQTSAQLDASASYLLVGGLGGIGRSLCIWMAQHGGKSLTFLTRNGGGSQRDLDFVKELESMGCNVVLVKGDVTNSRDVSRAVDASERLAPLKGVIQLSMVLRDQAFERMTYEDWTCVMEPKVKGTWNLHNITLERCTKLDFFFLFSSLSGTLGQVGQANYASANTFLDAFVTYRTGMGLPCSAIALGAMEDVGYLSEVENEGLLRKMQGLGWRANQESELLEAFNAAIIGWGEQEPTKGGRLVERNIFTLGIEPTQTQLQTDVRLGVYRNIRKDDSGNGASNDVLRSFLAAAKKDPNVLQSSEAMTIVASEIGKTLLRLLLRPYEGVKFELDTKAAELGLDSMVAVEIRAWWKRNFGGEISILEILSVGTIGDLGKKAIEALEKRN